MGDRQSMCAVARLRLQSSTVLVFAMLLSDQRRRKSRQLRTDVGGSCLDQSNQRHIHLTKSSFPAHGAHYVGSARIRPPTPSSSPLKDIGGLEDRDPARHVDIESA